LDPLLAKSFQVLFRPLPLVSAGFEQRETIKSAVIDWAPKLPVSTRLENSLLGVAEILKAMHPSNRSEVHDAEPTCCCTNLVVNPTTPTLQITSAPRRS
jgi:hypothetical protein